jgi:uncharacterized protein with LGFP repeats
MSCFNFFRRLFRAPSRVRRPCRRRPEQGRVRLGVENLETRFLMAANLTAGLDLAPLLAPTSPTDSQTPMIVAGPTLAASSSPTRLDLSHPNAPPSNTDQFQQEVSQAIFAKYNASAANLGAIVNVVQTLKFGQKDGVTIQFKIIQYLECEHGIVYYSGYFNFQPQVAEAHGVTYDQWKSLGGLQSNLGGPIADTTGLNDGQFTRFEKGTITWSPATDFHVLRALSQLWRDTPLYDLNTGTWLPVTTDVLGFPTMDEASTPDGSTPYCEFQKGIAFGAGRGAVEIHGPICDLWVSQGKFSNPLGLPTTSVTSTADGTGQYSFFEHGAIGTTPANGAHAIAPGAILDLWSGRIDDLGVPTTDQARSANGLGLPYQGFQKGLVFTSRVRPGGDPAQLLFVAQEIHGPIWQKWVDLSGMNSNLGAPVTGVTAMANGAGSYAFFENGSIVLTAAHGAHVLLGQVSDKFFQRDEASASWYLGFPTTDTFVTRDGRGLWAQFDGGDIFWSPDTGAQAHAVQAIIWDKWVAYNWDEGLLGSPTTDTIVRADGSRYNDFQKSTILWTPLHDTSAISGPIWAEWVSLGRENNTILGDPVGDVTPTWMNTGQFLHFVTGSIYWSQATGVGAHEVHGAIYDKWASLGWERLLGFPTADESGPDTYRQSTFQNGTIALSTYGVSLIIDHAPLIGLLDQLGTNRPTVDAVELQTERDLVADTAHVFLRGDDRALANKVLNGDPANANYQGMALGNLSAGSSAQQLLNLVNKWFLGLDRPFARDSKGNVYQYVKADGVLFGQDGPLWTDVAQGVIGDCYFLASLEATAVRRPDLIKGMFLDNGNDTWSVRFWNQGKADYVTVDKFLPVDGSGNFVYASGGLSVQIPVGPKDQNHLWVALAEKAYAQINESGWIGRDGTNTYSGRATDPLPATGPVGGLNNGSPTVALNQITNLATGFGILSSNISVGLLVLAWRSGQMITLDTSNPGRDDIVPNHSYVLLAMDQDATVFTLLNPWGAGASKPQVVGVTRQELIDNFNEWDFAG